MYFIKGKIQSMRSKWTFLTSHAVVLLSIQKDPKIKAIDIAHGVGLTERAVRAIIADIEKEKHLTKNKVGRRIKYSINALQPLRHQKMHAVMVGIDCLPF
jgi:predicted transcriptional regulator